MTIYRSKASSLQVRRVFKLFLKQETFIVFSGADPGGWIGWLATPYMTGLPSCITKPHWKIAGQSLSFLPPTKTAWAERQTNPLPYSAQYFGHKLHIDQNEKLVMYGVTHVCSIDGYSRYIPAFSCMLVKNNFIIYDEIFRYIFYSILFYDCFQQAKNPHDSTQKRFSQ